MSVLREYIRERIAVEDRGYSTPCWIWQRWLTEKGYARASVPGHAGRLVRVHRASYEEYVGPIADGLQIDHLCKVPSCVNPFHLEPVTHEENMRRTRNNSQDASRVRRKYVRRTPAPTHCRRGHELTPENMLICGDYRRCRQCKKTNDVAADRKLWATNRTNRVERGNVADARISREGKRQARTGHVMSLTHDKEAL